MTADAIFVKPQPFCNRLLTLMADPPVSRGSSALERDPLALVRNQISRRIDDIHARSDTLSPLDLHSRMDAIREIASQHGMGALEELARWSAQLALLPGHRVTLRSCLERLDEALDSRSSSDCTTILAALATRLH